MRCCLALFSLQVQSNSIALHDDGVAAFLVAGGKKILVGELMVSGLNTLRILLSFLVWKVDSFLRLLLVILQHSEQYRRVESM